MGYLDNEEEEDLGLYDPELQGAVASPAAVSPIPTSAKPPGDLESYLSGKYGSDMGDALRLENSQRLANNLGKAFNTIGTSLGTPGQKADNSFYDEQNKQASMPVKDVKDDRKNISNYLLKKFGNDAKTSQMKLGQDKLAEDVRHHQAMEKKGPAPGKEGFGQRAADVAAGKDYEDYVAGGGYSKVGASLDKLKEVRDQLRKDPKLTGGWSNLLPDAARSQWDPKGLALEQEVQSAILGNLKQIFGGKITEDQMRIFLKKSYDPRLSGTENADKLDRAIQEMEEKAKAKDSSMHYFEGHNSSLSGYKGSDAASLAAPKPAAPAVPEGMKLQRNKKTGATRLVPIGE